VRLAKGDRFALQKGDVIKAVQFYSAVSGTAKPLSDIHVEWDQGAFLAYTAQELADVRKLGLTVVRPNSPPIQVVLDGVEDATWPQADRGLVFDGDLRLERADTLGQALWMGVRHTGRTITRIYQSLGAMLGGRISFMKNASGPLAIAAVSYDVAGEGLSQFVLFIAMISVNLAVINFLPVPVLDGGHMVFLFYERFRGRPAPEPVRVAATLVGLVMIVSLMLFVIFLDVRNRL